MPTTLNFDRVPLSLKLRVGSDTPLSHDEMDKNLLMLMLLPFVENNCDSSDNATLMVNNLVSSLDVPLLSDGVHSLTVASPVLVVPIHVLSGFSLSATVPYSCMILDYDLKRLKHHAYFLDGNVITLDEHNLTNDYFLVVEFSAPIYEDVILTISNPL